MIGVGECSLGDVPSLIPAEMGLVEKDAHQFRDGHGRVGVVELNGDLVRESAPVLIVGAEAANDIGERTRDEEIFLYEAQRLASAGGIVGIKHTGDGFCGQGFSKGADEIAAAELLKVKVIRSRRSPQAKCVDVLSAISDNRPIIRNPKGGRLSSNGARTRHRV